MMKHKARSPPKLATGRLPLILACLLITCKHTGRSRVRKHLSCPLPSGSLLV